MVTEDAVPVAQSPVVGEVVKDWVLEVPQEPLIGEGVEVVVVIVREEVRIPPSPIQVIEIVVGVVMEGRV